MHNFEVLCEEKIKEKLIYCNFNGLDVYINPKKNFSKYYAAYGVKFGSIDNNFIFNGEKISLPDGTAHFLEHKMFEEESSDVFHNFASTGADGNAFTDFCLTSYLFSCTSQFYKNLDFLVGFVNRPYFTNDNIKKEVGIINEEIKMYDDNSNWRVFLNLLKAMYHKNPVRNDIAGDRNSIKKITKTKLYDAYNAFYTSENMSLVIVGDVEKEKIVDVLEKYVKKMKKILLKD